MLELVRAFVKSVIQEVAVEIPKSYRKKEAVRAEVQNMIATRIRNGEISSKEDLEEFFQALDMSFRALKMVPMEVFQGLKPKK